MCVLMLPGFFPSQLPRLATSGRAISMAISHKRNKYLDKCSTHGYEFGVLDFTTLGELGEDTCVFLKRLKIVSLAKIQIEKSEVLFSIN